MTPYIKKKKLIYTYVYVRVCAYLMFHLKIVFFFQIDETYSHEIDTNRRENYWFLVLSCSTGQYLSTFQLKKGFITVY